MRPELLFSLLCSSHLLGACTPPKAAGTQAQTQTPSATPSHATPETNRSDNNADAQKPRFVTVVLRDVAIAPTKRGGTAKWDPGGKIPQDTANKVALAVAKAGVSGANPYVVAGAVFIALAPAMGGVLSAPEIAGNAQLRQKGQRVGTVKMFNMYGPRDTCYVAISGAAGESIEWTDVDLDADPRIMGKLWDNDNKFDSPDPIGSFEIRKEHIEAALKGDGSAKPYPVRIPVEREREDRSIVNMRIGPS